MVTGPQTEGGYVIQAIVFLPIILGGIAGLVAWRMMKRAERREIERHFGPGVTLDMLEELAERIGMEESI